MTYKVHKISDDNKRGLLIGLWSLLYEISSKLNWKSLAHLLMIPLEALGLPKEFGRQITKSHNDYLDFYPL